MHATDDLTGELGWVPEGVSLDQPNVARMYDYLLGGYHNFEVDRIVAEKARQAYPDVGLTAQVLRGFLRRCVQFLVEQGIDQFLDIGSGIPTVGNVHEVAQQANPAARVVYVDIDPSAVAHSQAILRGNPNAAAIQADVRQPERILDHVEVKRLLDLRRPAALLLVALLHFVSDDEQAYRVVDTLRDALAPGSFVAITHGTYDNAPLEVMRRLERLTAGTPTPARYRTRAEIQRFLGGLEWVEPGLVPPPLWRPEGPDDLFLDQPERSLGLGGVGYKP
jgi:SAM-dependent methyltransferase